MAGTKNSGGHNKKSTQSHVLHGTFRRDRHGDDGGDTPEPPKGKPVPPRPLSAIAQEEWDRMVDRLDKNQVLTIVDDAALFQYCQLFAETEAIKDDNVRLRDMSVTLMEMAKKLTGPDLVETVGKIVDIEHELSKQHTKLRQGHMAIRQFLVEFGMTPAARSRVSKNPGGGPAASKSAVDRFRQAKHQ